MTPVLDRIILYPIKSMDGTEVSQVEITPGGTLQNDRTLAMFDENGDVVNGKRTEKVHGLRTHYDLAGKRVTISPRGTDAVFEFNISDGYSKLETWLSGYLDIPIKIRENINNGFPDDVDAWGPTVVSVASLKQVTEWFPGVILEGARARFRANIELTNVPAFWEDQLYSDEGSVLCFQIGDVQFEGVNPCQRCPVPARDPWSGDALSGFQKTFSEKRRETLPAWAEAHRFDHYYRFAVNTRIPASETGKVLSRGDKVKIHGVRAI